MQQCNPLLTIHEFNEVESDAMAKDKKSAVAFANAMKENTTLQSFTLDASEVSIDHERSHESI